MTVVRFAPEPTLPVADFRAVLVESGLGATRPVDDPDRLAATIAGADVIITARLDQPDNQLIGVARAVSDASWCCYLSELAVSGSAQGLSVGRGLIDFLRAHIGAQVSLILASMPESVGFYEAIGMPRQPDAFWFKRER